MKDVCKFLGQASLFILAVFVFAVFISLLAIGPQ